MAHQAAIYRYLTLALTALACGVLTSCPKDQAQKLGIHFDLDQRQLRNGLTVLMVEQPQSPIVSYQTWIRVGSVDEDIGTTGMSHFLEHLMFKGTPKVSNTEFFNRLEAKGADVNAATARDYTFFYEHFAPELLDQVIELEADRYANFKVSDEMLMTEKMVVFEERRLSLENTPEGKIQEAIWALAFKAHPYQTPVIGWVQDIAGASAEGINKHRAKYYVPRNTAVVVVGKIDRDKTFEKIRAAYGDLEDTERPTRKVRDEPEQLEERRLIIRADVTAPQLVQAFHIPSARDDSAYAVDILSNILFEGESSRVYQKLVREKQVLLGVGASSYTPTFPGLLLVTATLKSTPEQKAVLASSDPAPPPKGGSKTETKAAAQEGAKVLDSFSTDSVEKELDAIYRDIVKNGVTQEELDRAVNQLTVQILNSVRSPQGLAQLIGLVFVTLGDPSLFQEDLAKYFKVKRGDVQAVAEKYLYSNNKSVVVVVPEPPAVKKPPSAGKGT